MGLNSIFPSKFWIVLGEMHCFINLMDWTTFSSYLSLGEEVYSDVNTEAFGS